MTNIPTKLITELMSLSDKFEEYYRQDERQKILSQIADREQRLLNVIFADKNGEQTSGAAKSVRQRRGFHANSKLGKLYRCLARRTYAVTKNTLIRETGMTKSSVYQGISTLREKGYKIESVFGKGSKARYKLAS
tara:strand:+ start:2057 stop:2461 length:405 start_codon:yes stop_codon:yes gene_type:complete